MAAAGQRQPSITVPPDPSWYRADGTLKGQGFLGVFKNTDGQSMSENSIADSNKLRDPHGDIYPGDQGRESYPSIVPGITYGELNRILNGTGVAGSLADKATAFALARRANRDSLFAGPGETRTDLLPMLLRAK